MLNKRSLGTEKEELAIKYEEKLNSGSEYIEASISGVVSYRVDNLENVLTPDNFNDLDERIIAISNSF